MPKTQFKKTYGWKAAKKAFDPRVFDKKTRKYMKIASGRIGLMGVRNTRKVIQKGGFAPNKPLTVAIKRSSKPLVDDGELFQSITYQVMNEYTVFVGVLKTSGIYNIAVMIHDGGIIPVTWEMRGLFWILWLASQGTVSPNTLSGRAKELWDRMPGGWKPIGVGTRAIVIVSRPFMRQAFQDPELHRIALNHWHEAINLAMRELAAGK